MFTQTVPFSLFTKTLQFWVLHKKIRNRVEKAELVIMKEKKKEKLVKYLLFSDIWKSATKQFNTLNNKYTSFVLKVEQGIP